MIKGTHDEVRAYMRRYINTRYRKIMDKIIVYLGGSCTNCGSTENLQVDHIDSKTKLFNVSTGIQNYSKEKLWEEIKKCQLLCKSCHRLKSLEEGTASEAQHGSYSMCARHKCRCDICKVFPRDKARRYREELRGRVA